MRIASHRGRERVAALILAAFIVYALIPQGFMPGGGRLSIQVCPDGFPTQLLSLGGHDTHGAHHTQGAHHTHGGSPAHTDHCVFAGAGAGGPLSSLLPLASASVVREAPAVDVRSVATTVRLVHLPQPRAPPGRLS